MIVPGLFGKLSNLDDRQGIRMWDLLKKADIDGAKREINLRRAETLRRQAEEYQNLNADRAKLETLNELIDIFVQKYAQLPIMPQVPAAAPIATQKVADK